MTLDRFHSWQHLAQFWAERLADAVVAANNAPPVGPPLDAAVHLGDILRQMGQAAFLGQDIRVHFAPYWRWLVSSAQARAQFVAMLAEWETAGQPLVLNIGQMPPEWLSTAPPLPRHRQSAPLIWETTWLEPPALLDAIVQSSTQNKQPITVHFSSTIDIETADLDVVFSTVPDVADNGLIPMVSLARRVIEATGFELPLFIRLTVGSYHGTAQVGRLPASIFLDTVPWAAFSDPQGQVEAALQLSIGSLPL